MRKAGPNEESRERSRAKLLQAGADLILDEALQKPFAALKLRKLCERAGLSTGAFFVHWDTLDKYYADLATYLTEADNLTFEADFALLAELAKASDWRDAVEAIESLAERDLAALMINPLWDAMELIALTWGRTHFRDQLFQGYETVDHMTGQIYGSVLAKRGREPRPPLDWDEIGAILQGLAEGFGLRHKIEYADIPKRPDSASGLYVTAVATVLAVLTRPIGDKATTSETIRSLLSSPASGE
jgi:AcrR family transcriptional regulator